MISSLPDRPLRRHILYIPGYAPAGPESHRKLFKREAARFAALWDVETEVSELEPVTAEHRAAFQATTRMPGATVETAVEVLRWDDLVKADFRTPLLGKLGHGLATLVDGVASGTLLRVARTGPWFAFAWIYPYLGLLLCLAVGGGLGRGASSFFDGPLALLVGLLVAAVAAYGALALVQRTPLFVVHLLDDWIAQRRYIRRNDPILDLRLAGFAERLAEVVAKDDADEVLVVGHSSGSILAIDVVARAFEADPTLGRRGPPLSLLTLGAAELLIAFHPAAGWFRERIARLATERSLCWAEVAGRWDALTFAERDPVTELGLAVPEDRPNPQFRRVALKRLLTRPTILRLARKLRVFRVHFQYVMANELRGPYDFFALACGARSVREQFARAWPDEAMAPFPIAAPDAGRLRGS